MSGEVARYYMRWNPINGVTYMAEADGTAATLYVLATDYAALQAKLDAVTKDAERWQHVKECSYSYGDGYTEPREFGIALEWLQGPWIRDGSNGGQGRPDEFPGWDAYVDDLIAKQKEYDAEDDAALTDQGRAGEEKQ